MTKNINAKISPFYLALLLHMKLMLRGLNITIECKPDFVLLDIISLAIICNCIGRSGRGTGESSTVGTALIL